tara:strand:- start:38 stop:280 length:243 start_codon:yes stop_codon:yes gene_type:complete
MVIREVVYADLVAQVPDNQDLISFFKTQEFHFCTNRTRYPISSNRHWLIIQKLAGNALFNASSAKRLRYLNARVVTGQFP